MGEEYGLLIFGSLQESCFCLFARVFFSHTTETGLVLVLEFSMKASRGSVSRIQSNPPQNISFTVLELSSALPRRVQPASRTRPVAACEACLR